MKHGARANKSGKVLEGQVKTVFEGWFSTTTQEYRTWEKHKTYPALVRNVPYTTFYGTIGRSEFVFYFAENVAWRIECKWQEVSGSVDEKFPYMLECMKTVSEQAAIIIVAGGGAKPAAVNWLRKACVGTKVHLCSSVDDLTKLVQSLHRQLDNRKGEF